MIVKVPWIKTAIYLLFDCTTEGSPAKRSIVGDVDENGDGKSPLDVDVKGNCRRKSKRSRCNCATFVYWSKTNV